MFIYVWPYCVYHIKVKKIVNESFLFHFVALEQATIMYFNGRCVDYFRLYSVSIVNSKVNSPSNFQLKSKLIPKLQQYALYSNLKLSYYVYLIGAYSFTHHVYSISIGLYTLTFIKSYFVYSVSVCFYSNSNFILFLVLWLQLGFFFLFCVITSFIVFM